MKEVQFEGNVWSNPVDQFVAGDISITEVSSKKLTELRKNGDVFWARVTIEILGPWKELTG